MSERTAFAPAQLILGSFPDPAYSEEYLDRHEGHLDEGLKGTLPFTIHMMPSQNFQQTAKASFFASLEFLSFFLDSSTTVCIHDPYT